VTIAARIIRLLGMNSLPPLNEELTKLELVYHVPPLRREFASAINLISPQYKMVTNEKCCAFWEAESNGSCWGEYEALAPVFQSMPKPRKILELGPGFGRSIVKPTPIESETTLRRFVTCDMAIFQKG
jgi:hypothetical protein